MALDFYSSTYLHSLPAVHTTPGRETFKQNGFIGLGLGKMEKGESPLDEIIQDLVARAFQAEAVEQKFFSMFGVSSADEWNRKYMGIGLFDGVDLQNRDIRNKVFQSVKGFNIYNKTMLTLNTRGFAHSILEFNSNITRDSKALNEIMRKSLLRVVEMGLEKTR